jgi:hypothetical protein
MEQGDQSTGHSAQGAMKTFNHKSHSQNNDYNDDLVAFILKLVLRMSVLIPFY